MIFEIFLVEVALSSSLSYSISNENYPINLFFTKLSWKDQYLIYTHIYMLILYIHIYIYIYMYSYLKENVNGGVLFIVFHRI